ncbi:MAG: hypothetical protein PF482_04345 [Desulfobacteraceae bacterium]|jgi:hypothetical protein|nr:hypothetical protein [Desulfobacteraceae bacterium]
MEPVTISLIVLGTAFTNEGIKFLWKQADTIVNRYNKRRYKDFDQNNAPAEAKDPETIVTIDTADAPRFLELPSSFSIDFDRAKEKAGNLAVLSEALAPYAKDERRPDTLDKELTRTMDTLQQILEYVYHQPFQVNEEVCRNIVEATRGGTVDIGTSDQHVKESGENVIRAEGPGSSIKIGKSDQKIG